MNEVVAVIDANVLYSFYLREFFMRLSRQAKLFQAKWSDEINKEWSRNLLKNKPHLKKKDVDATIKWMNRTIQDAVVDPKPFMPIVEKINFPDKNDMHVVAAALASRAQFIVTKNLKHFPNKKIENFGIEAIHPDDFAEEYVEDFPEDVIRVLINMSEDYEHPSMTPREVIAALGRAELIKTASRLEKLIS